MKKKNEEKEQPNKPNDVKKNLFNSLKIMFFVMDVYISKYKLYCLKKSRRLGWSNDKIGFIFSLKLANHFRSALNYKLYWFSEVWINFWMSVSVKFFIMFSHM